METKQAILPLSAPVSTSILLCFGNRHNHITVFDETIFVSSMTLYQQAVSSYIQRPFLRCKMLVGKSQTLELHPMDAGYAFLQNAFATCNFVHQTCISLPEPLRFAAQLVIIKRERTFTEKRRKHHAYFGMDRKKQSCQSSSGSAVPCVGASV